MAKASAQRGETSREELVLERRKSQRAELVVRVEYQTVDELFSEFARNINEGGIFVETETPPEAGVAVDLRFKLPGGDEPIRVRGMVVHVSDGRGLEPPGMGIEFENLDASARHRINALVRRLRAAAPR